MDKSVVVALISGTFSTCSALGAVFLKDWLEARRQRRAQQKTAEAVPTPSSPVPARSQTRAPSMPPAVPMPAPASALPQSAPARASTHLRPVVIVVGSVLFGMLSRAMRAMVPGQVHYDAIIELAVMLAFAAWLAIDHRRRGGVVGFELENLALWSGWTCGWLLIHGQIWGDLLSLGFMAWLGCAVIGAVFAGVGNRARSVAPA
jgi:hypothetical protein